MPKKHNIASPLIIQLTLILSLDLIMSAAYANPELGGITSGNAAITQSNHNTVINQSSQQAIINWNSFNIDANESTHFQQPTGGMTLNRISANQGASRIFGKLSATGSIILVNGAGIYFGPTAMVNVSHLIASTSDISNAHFLSGNYIFDQPSAYNGSIVNDGKIIASNHGLVALLGTSTVNNGLIQAELGNVILASGNQFTLDFNGDQLVNFGVNGAITQKGVDADGNILNSGVSNTGTILADGGKIIVTAQAAQGVLDNVIDMGGVAQARSVSHQDGAIILSGGANGNVVVSGTLDASGKTSEATGGDIKVLGNVVHLASTASVDVSGDKGGGEILVGGNYHGTGLEQRALSTIIDAGAVLNANALTQGNGGKVIAWSDGATLFHGNIFAQGGALGGNGGFVETSGHYLNIANSRVNTLAHKGLTGTWLLDPNNVSINSDPSSNSGQHGDIYQPNNGDGAPSTINAGELMTALESSNIEVTTTAFDGAPGPDVGDISVDAALNWTSANSLTLTAVNNIYLNADITALNGGLRLSAVNGVQSLTTGTIGSGSIGGPVGSVTANINVKDFSLLQGQWFQSSPTLPVFNVTHDFDITVNSSVYNNYYNAQFTRLNTSGGFNGISDVFGLQGIASGFLNTDYQVMANIDGQVTQFWQNGLGFAPVAFSATNEQLPYIGTFDGGNFTISNLFESLSGEVFGGLFANSGGTLRNVNLTNFTINVTQDPNSTTFSAIGLLAGQNFGTVSNSSSSGIINATLNSNTSYLGGLVGFNSGNITGSTSTANISVTAADNPVIYAGGIFGLNNGGSVTNSFIPASSANVFTLNSASPTQNWIINGANSGTVTFSDISSSVIFNGFQNIVGGDNNDNFTITPTGSISGSVNGGGGANTINFNAPATLNVGGSNVSVNGHQFSFSNIQTFSGTFNPVITAATQTALNFGVFGVNTSGEPAEGVNPSETALAVTVENIMSLAQNMKTMEDQVSKEDSAVTNSKKINANC